MVVYVYIIDSKECYECTECRDMVTLERLTR